MKKLCSLFILLFFVMPYYAQQVEMDDSPNSGLGIGFQLNNYQKDFGLGLTVTSPYLGKGSIAFRGRANYMYFEHPDISGEATWTPYYNFQAGVIGGSAVVANFLRMYGEGGVVLILPSSDFSTESQNIGGYGVFGFEFFMDKYNNYFIELGGMGSGATADKIWGKPIYSNGFTISVGYRIVL